jgi:HK97 family phage prohead protease
MTVAAKQTKSSPLDHAVTQFKFDRFETKSENGNEFAFFCGYASVFGNVDGAGDIIEAGAFTKTLVTEPNVKLLWQHDTWQVIGSIPEIRQDANGLFITGRINLGTKTGKEAYALLKAGDLDSMSIGYRVLDSEYDSKTDIRTIKEVYLGEVSLVTFPANKQAKITSVKSIDSAESLSDIEDILKNKGFSNKQSKALIARLKSLALTHRDDEVETQRDATSTKSAEDYSNFINSLKTLIKEINHV